MIATNLRFHGDAEKLFEAIKKSAQKNRRSLNSELLRAVEFYLTNADETKPVEKEATRKQSPK